ncbi:MAG: rod shape-determining protein MreC [Rikenellaceae bacterium]
MNRFFLLFKKIHLFLLFVLIEGCAIFYYSQSSIYTNAKLIDASDFMVRGVSGIINRGSKHIDIVKENRELYAEISRLNDEIEGYRAINRVLIDSLFKERTGLDTMFYASTFRDSMGITVKCAEVDEKIYSFHNVDVVRNSISSQRNFITLSKGLKDGLQSDMALIQNNMVVGYIVECSENYSVALSLLNRDFKTSGRDLKDSYFGSISWDGVSTREVILEEIPKYANIAIGDTIVTTQFSTRFPEGVKIGTVKEFKQVGVLGYRAIISLFINMSKLTDVVAIRNKDYDERTELEENNS